MTRVRYTVIEKFETLLFVKNRNSLNVTLPIPILVFVYRFLCNEFIHFDFHTDLHTSPTMYPLTFILIETDHVHSFLRVSYLL